MFPFVLWFTAFTISLQPLASPFRVLDTDGRQVAPEQRKLIAAIARVAAPARGVVSVTTIDVRTGLTVSFNGAAPVFMSSVVKLPLSVQLLDRVDRGELRLSDSIVLAPHDLRVENGGLASEHPHGVTLTVGQLLERAVSRSDNSASDALMRYSGGPRAVMRELGRLGMMGIRVDRFYAQNTWAYHGIRTPPPEAQWTPTLIDSVAEAASPETQRRGADEFLADARDRATARGVAQLLRRLWARELLTPGSFALLSRLMTETQNPSARLVAGAPRTARVAHKTGTWGTGRRQAVAVNDVGVLSLAGGRQIVLAVMIGGGRAPAETQEAVIRNVTRAVVDFWMNSPRGSAR